MTIPGSPATSTRFAGSGSGSRPPKGPSCMSLRARLLAAFAYTLIVVIVALEVPLAANLSSRVNSEVEADSAAKVAVVAATATDQLDRPARLQQVVDQASSSLNGLVF